jgi:putative membrane protein
MTDRRFPPTVYREGAEPDPRFSLANERTFLAWLRTSLALFAAAVGLEALGIPTSPGLRIAAAGVFLALGLVSAVRAWVGWARTERSLRLGRPLAGFPLGAVLALGVVLGASLVAIGLLL